MAQRAVDDEGFLLPGELSVGSYAAIDGDLGEKLRPLAGFGRDLEEPEWEDEGVVAPGGVSTGLEARYVLRGWNG